MSKTKTKTKPKAQTTAKAKAKAKIVVKKTLAKKSAPKLASKPVVKKKTPVKTVAVKKPAATKLAAKKPLKKAPAGLPEQIRDTILRILDDRQAEQVVTIDLRGKSSMADYLVIGSGRASRQIAAIADLVRADLAQKFNQRQVRIEGVSQGDWVLIDAGDVIVHLFRPEVRKFYNIENIYGLSA